jgi:hypothetical protein
LLVPQIPAADAPRGKSEADNVEIKRWGEPRRASFELRDHVALLELHGWAELQRPVPEGSPPNPCRGFPCGSQKSVIDIELYGRGIELLERILAMLTKLIDF